MHSAPTQFSLPALLFQFSSNGLEFLNRSWEDYPGLTPNRWLGILRGGWRSLVPEEYHSEVQKLSLEAGYTVVQFPVYWQETTLWLLVFAAAVEEPDGGRKIVGSVQDITLQREWACAPATAERECEEPTAGAIQNLCHDLSGPLTSILVNCELLLEGECPPAVRSKLESIFSEAIQIDRLLRLRRP
ncbi:MAG TPA: histidine kinase dimerization/phospho-acceptor domain-containing protein [Terriglobia bacterium]|jgi:hypothetical protein